MSKQRSSVKTAIKNFRVADIRVLGQHRPLVKEKVRELVDSIKAIGLKTPPTVRLSKKGPVLVTGHHRLAAAKKLGWHDIDCIVMHGDKIERLLWFYAENLHRADLTVLQRANYFNKWKELIRKQAKVTHIAAPGGRQPNDRGLNKTAKAMGISKDKASRHDKIDNISPTAQKAAKKARLDNNQAALLKVAKESTSKGQKKRCASLPKASRLRAVVLSCHAR